MKNILLGDAVKSGTRIVCPYCDSEAKLESSEKIYGFGYGEKYGMAWICSRYPVCDSYVGAHKNSGEPKGSLANPRLRKARMMAHNAFDQTWKFYHREVGRGGCYEWLAERMGIHKNMCHIGMFEVEQCEQVMKIMSDYHSGLIKKPRFCLFSHELLSKVKREMNNENN